MKKCQHLYCAFWWRWSGLISEWKGVYTGIIIITTGMEGSGGRLLRISILFIFLHLSLQTHIYLHLYNYINYDTQGFFAYIPGYIWTIQHVTDTLSTSMKGLSWRGSHEGTLVKGLSWRGSHEGALVKGLSRRGSDEGTIMKGLSWRGSREGALMKGLSWRDSNERALMKMFALNRWAMLLNAYAFLWYFLFLFFSASFF